MIVNGGIFVEGVLVERNIRRTDNWSTGIFVERIIGRFYLRVNNYCLLLLPPHWLLFSLIRCLFTFMKNSFEVVIR